MENLSYGLTICDDRNAIFHAVDLEGPNMKIDCIVITTSTQEPFFSLCGACRQVIQEFSTPDTLVIYKYNNHWKQVPLSCLLEDAAQL